MTTALLAEGYRQCEQITRQHGTTYYWGARLLPPASRRHVHAVYALARLADDIVDDTHDQPVSQRERRLDEFVATFWSARAGGVTAEPVMTAIVASVQETGITDECFARFFRAMRTDLTKSSYQTWPDLLDYMDGSAAVIGEMMLPVLAPNGFGATSAAAAHRAARSLGQAFQLTNFLRDVAEDLDRGRVYLPQEDLDRYGADPRRRQADPAWRAMMAFQIERNRRLYREADAGIPLLPKAAQRCVGTARVLYARILEHIEAGGYDVFSRRARVPTRTKAALAARMLVHPHPMAVVRADRAARPPRLGHWNDDLVVLVDETGEPTASARKSHIHHDDTPLHLGFSCYIFDENDNVLVTTRAHHKPSFPGLETNSVCGHPRPGEDAAAAVVRRAREELGLAVETPSVVLPSFRYRAVAESGLVENEVCPVFMARALGTDLALDPGEVADAQWVPWSLFATQVSSGDRAVSPWCVEQVRQLMPLGSAPREWRTTPVTRLPAAARPSTTAGRASTTAGRP